MYDDTSSTIATNSFNVHTNIMDIKSMEPAITGTSSTNFT